VAKAVEYEMSQAGNTDVQWLQIKKGNSSQTLSVAGVVKTWLARLSLAQISVWRWIPRFYRLQQKPLLYPTTKRSFLLCAGS
jgi:hypothetical protein